MFCNRSVKNRSRFWGKKTMKYSCKLICQSFLYCLFSHLGTLILIILYLIGGGFLFRLLELQNEITACKISYDLLSQKLNDSTLRGMAIGQAGYTPEIYYKQLYQMLLNYTKDIYTLNISPNKDCETLDTPNNLPNWNLANAIFFCATIVTTIGLGRFSVFFVFVDWYLKVMAISLRKQCGEESCVSYMHLSGYHWCFCFWEISVRLWPVPLDQFIWIFVVADVLSDEDKTMPI